MTTTPATTDRTTATATAVPTRSPGRRPVLATRAAFVAAGLAFVAYPALRPFSSETGLEGARAFASPAWVWAHGIAIVGFTLLALALGGWLVERLTATPGDRRGLGAVAAVWIGTALTLPYYGAEVFGLHALGGAALDGDPAAMTTVDAVRWGPGLWFILAGLLVLAAGVVAVAGIAWRSGTTGWLGLPLAVAMALYLPQFFVGQPLRVAHGVLVLVGCVCMAAAVGRHGHADR